MDPFSQDLFACELGERSGEVLRPSVVLLRAYALEREAQILAAVRAVESSAAFRHMTTPGGFRMSVAMTNCGELGWVSDSTGYRYDPTDPESGRPWPSMPGCLRDLAQDAAASAGFPAFQPDACLVNRYAVGSRLSLHQDKDERDFGAPIVSVSLGAPAVFQVGGLKRSDRALRIAVRHGDVIVWGGSARLLYHGVMPLKHGFHAAFGSYRVNLTFRKAG